MVEILTDMLIADELLVKYGGASAQHYRDSVKMMILQRNNMKAEELDSIIILTQKNLKHYHHLQTLVSARLDSLKSESFNKKP